MTKNVKYESKIKLLDGPVLSIDVTYETVVTHEYAERQKTYYQYKFSRKYGTNVRRDQIKIKPDVGDPIEYILTLVVTPGKPLYVGLYETKEEAPYVLPRLIDDLKEFEEKNKLTGAADELLVYAINGLTEISKSNFKITSGHPNAHVIENPDFSNR